MRYVGWILKFVVFVVLLALAMQNSDIVTLKLFLGYTWQAPLILLLLIFFGVGTAFGLTAGFFYYLKLRRELTGLKKELRLRQQTGSQVVSDPSDAVAD